MNNLPSVEEVTQLLDLKDEGQVARNESELQSKYGLTLLVPIYVQAFYKIKNWAGRMNITFWLARYARKYPDVIEMAIFGLNDRSRIVRNYCCGILAYGQSKSSIPYLNELVNHKDESTREDAVAVITAIENRNHHLWVDRENKGNTFWEVGKIS